MKSKTEMQNLATVTHLGFRRVVLVDPDTEWRLVVRVDLEARDISIASGNGDIYSWSDFADPVVNSASNVDTNYMKMFGRFVIDNFVGDERIADCINYLIWKQS